MEHGNETVPGDLEAVCVCLARGERFVATAQDETHCRAVADPPGSEFCEQDIFDKVMPYDTVVPNEDVPKLAMHPSIERFLEQGFHDPGDERLFPLPPDEGHRSFL